MKKVTARPESKKRKRPDPGKEIDDLREKIRELEQTLDAIRSGEVDAIIVAKGDAHKIYTLEGVDHPYQILVENIQEGVLTLSREGMILYTNTRFGDMVELPPEKLPGTSILDHICPEYCREIEEALRNIPIHASRNRIHLRRGSSSFPVLLSMSPLSSSEDTKISVVITDRSFDEGQLQLQAKMLEAAGDSIIAVDVNLKIIFWNAAATKASGWTSEEIVGQDLIDIIVAEDSKPEAREIAERIKCGGIWTGNFSVRHKDGHFFPVYANAAPLFDVMGNLSAIIIASHDISDQIRAEKMLRESEKRYRTIADFTHDWEFWIDPEGRFKYISPSADRILGRPVSQFDSADELFREIIHPDDLEILLAHMIQEKAGMNLSEVEFRIVRPDGEVRWLNHVCLPVHDDDGKFIGTRGSNRDISDRKRIEEALHESEEKYRLIFETANEGIWITDEDRKTILVNRRMTDMLGYSANEMLGTTPSEYLAPDQETICLKTAEDLAKGKSIQEEFKFRRKDGSDLWVISRASPVFDSKGRYTRTVSLLADITERKDAEDALHEAHTRTAAILESVADTFYSLDNQWRFITVNPAAEKAPFGQPASELLGRVIWDLYPALVGTQIHQHYLNAAQEHSLEHYEARSPLNGRWYEVFMQGREGGVDVYMRDITGRKQAEEALLMSEERLRLAQESSGAGIWDWDIRSGEITWDSNMFRLWGFDPGNHHPSFELWNHILHPEDREVANAKIEQALKDHTMLFNEFRIIRPDGEMRWINALGKGIYDQLGEPVRMSGICIDITERRKTEQALQESEKRFRLALRNAPVSVAIQNKDLVFQWAYNQRSIRPEEVKGKKDTDIFTPEDAARLIELKRRCIETGKIVREKIWLTMNGRKLFLDLYLEPLHDENGQITGVGIATVDLTEQKLTEEMLRFSEENLLQAQELLEAVTKGTDVIIAVQDRNFRYIFFNQAYKEVIKRLTGKDLSIGTSMIELFAGVPKEQTREINEWSKVLAGEQVNETITFGDPDGHRRVYHVLHTPIRDAQGTIIAAGEVAFDISKQAQVEEALRETKEYLDNLITYANAPIIVWDPQFRITRFNHASEHLTGRKAKDVIGKPLEFLLPEHYGAPAMDLIRKTTEGERWESVEIPILHKKGGIRTVLWNSASIFGSDGKTIISTIAQGQDITDRKKIESEYRHRAAEYAKINRVLEEEVRQRKISDIALKETLSLLNASLESTADGILVVDLRGKITSFNKNFMNIWNIPQEVLESGDSHTVLHHVLPQIKNPKDYLTGIRELEVHPGRESFDMVEFSDGKIFERYSKPQKLGNTVVGRVWSFRDVTDRKRAEENLLASIHEKEVLLREIHHRVKNNLQLISGLLDMTRMRTTDESTNTILTDLMLKIQTMAQIHTRLYESKQFRKISLSGQIRDQVAALSNIYTPKEHEIICEMDAQEIFLPVDQAIPCALVVNEILSNAYKHAFKGRKRGTIELSAVQENGQIKIMIRDDGIGIPGNFDISRTNSLGLKLIRTLVQSQLKGSLMVKSQHGTEVTVEFPIITEET